MTWLKFKFAVGVGVAALLAGGTATVVISQTGGGDKLTPQEILQKAQDKYASLTSYSDEGITVATVNGMTLTTTFNIRLARPDLYRIEWAHPVPSKLYQPGRGLVGGPGRFFGNGERFANTTNQQGIGSQQRDRHIGRCRGDRPGTFFKQNWGNQLGAAGETRRRESGRRGLLRPCQRIERPSRTLWIGKADFLIHQVRTVTSPEALKAALDQAAKVNPTVH